MANQDSKMTPEESILSERVIYQAVMQVIRETLDKKIEYSQAFSAIVERVIKRQDAEIDAAVSRLLRHSIVAAELSQTLQSEFDHKVAKLLMAKCSGLTEKALNDLMSNPISRSEVTLAVRAAVTKAAGGQSV